MITIEETKTQLQITGRYMMDHALAWGNAGNISARINPEECLITASGTYLGELGKDDFVTCPITREPEKYEKKPSKELPMHRAVYEERPDIQAVLHASPFYSTLIACTKKEIPSNLFVETMYYLERVERVPYFHPGSHELAASVREKASEANILILENHGVLVYDTSLKEARMALETLEMACRMWLSAEQSGIDFSTLSESTVTDFLVNAGYKPRRKWTSK